jgi:hypothetical protein
MATFVSDSFTDTSGTALASHTGETGATWTKSAISGTGALEISNANRCRHDGNASTLWYYASGTPINANYDVQATVRFLSDVDSQNGVSGRMSTSVDTMYIAFYNTNATANFDLYKVVAGSYTQLGTYADALSAGNERVLLLRMDGDQISVYIDAVLRIGPITDTGVTVANRAGIRAYNVASDTTGLHIDTFSATDIVAAGGSVGSGLTTGLKLERLRLVA